VDLTQPDARRKSRNTRFLKRVFTPDELSAIRSSPSPELTLWACWAAKEAAYKAISKTFPNVPAVPRLFPVFLDPEGDAGSPDAESRKPRYPRYGAGFVLTPRGKCWLRIVYRPAYLHCLAFTDHPEGLTFSWRVHYLFSCLSPGASAESEAVRLASRFHLAGLLSADPGELAISRQQGNLQPAPPRISFQGLPLEVDISLSHDGLFIAHACLLKRSEASTSPGL